MMHYTALLLANNFGIAETDYYIHDTGEGMFATKDYAERRLLAPHLLAEPS